MILNFSKYSIWSGKFPVADTKFIPKLSYFNGGCYFKIGFRWFRYLVELSGPKKDTTVYVKKTKKEIDIILNNLQRKNKRAKHQNRTDIR
jgi:hypothetical protein